MDTPLAWVLSRDTDMRRVIDLNLCKRGMRCLDLTGPVEGEPHLAMPQLILLDIDLAAGLDWETARTLRRNPRLRDVPLIIMAALLPPASQLAALHPFHGVHKPLAMDELLAQVRESLEKAGTG